jgi:hypothetical protein
MSDIIRPSTIKVKRKAISTLTINKKTGYISISREVIDDLSSPALSFYHDVSERTTFLFADPDGFKFRPLKKSNRYRFNSRDLVDVLTERNKDYALEFEKAVVFIVGREPKEIYVDDLIATGFPLLKKPK